MDAHEWQTDQFEQSRTHLRAVAYRILASIAEADDAVQEAWLRLNRSDTSAVENLRGWLTTVVSRVALDMLRARQSRHEEVLDGPLAEPVITIPDPTDPEQQALMADSVGLALLVVLETLSPAERLAFVLHDMFGMSFAEIAPIVERNPAATRQLASRARRRVRGAAPDPYAHSLAEQRRWWTRSSLRRATATSTPSSRCSIRTWSSMPTAPACCRAQTRCRARRRPHA